MYPEQMTAFNVIATKAAIHVRTMHQFAGTALERSLVPAIGIIRKRR